MTWMWGEVTITRMFSQAVQNPNTMPSPSVSILIPVYKNEGGLEELVNRIAASMSTHGV